MRQISINDIVIDAELKDDIYTERNGFIPVLRKGTLLNRDALAKIIKNGIPDLFIEEKPMRTLPTVITLSKIWEVLNVPYKKEPPILPVELKRKGIELLRDVYYTFNQQNINECVRAMNDLEMFAHEMVNHICLKRGSTINIYDLHDGNEFIYHHSLGVTVVSVAIGHSMGLDYNNLVTLAACAMLHDIGKSAIPAELLNKAVPLTETEHNRLKDHSLLGYKLLYEKNLGSEFGRQVILYHHEKVDGSGYPYGLTGEKIPLLSKIIFVADVFDAMTSKRPYRDGVSATETMDFLIGSNNTSFDFNVVNAFIKKIEPYPVGSFVELSNGKIAVVIEIRNTLRPVVKIMETNSVADLSNDRNYLSVIINRIIPYSEVLLNVE